MSEITRSIGYDEFVRLYNADKITRYNMGGPNVNKTGDITFLEAERNLSEKPTHAERLLGFFLRAATSDTDEARKISADNAVFRTNSHVRALKSNNRHADAETYDIRDALAYEQLSAADNAYIHLANSSTNKAGELYHWIETQADGKLGVKWEEEKIAPVLAKAKEKGLIRLAEMVRTLPEPAPASL